MKSTFVCKSLEDTEKLAKAFAKTIGKSGCFVSLFGEIGAGKTTFTKFALKEMGVEKKVTSPSFVILNEYKGKHLPVYHFDLYRLEKEGIQTISEELREYSKDGVLTLVEWADFGSDELPFERLNISISYGNKEDRVFELRADDKRHEEIIKKIEATLK